MKWLVAACAVGWLLREGMASGGKFAFTTTAPWWLAAAAAVYIGSTAGMAVRFHFLLRMLGRPSGIREQMRLFFAGLFPQLIGSIFAFDAMRAAVLHRSGMTAGMIGGALLSERLIGLLTLLFTSASLLFLFLELGDVWISLAAAAFCAALVPLLFQAWRKAVATNRPAFLKSLPGSSLVCSMADTMQALARKPLNLLALFLMSIIVQLTQLSMVYFVGNALKNIQLPFIESITGSALAGLTGMFPLPMGGAGVGEGVFGAVAAAAQGRGNAADFAPAYLLCRLLNLAVGAAAWLWLAASGYAPLRSPKKEPLSQPPNQAD